MNLDQSVCAWTPGGNRKTNNVIHKLIWRRQRTGRSVEGSCQVMLVMISASVYMYLRRGPP